VATTGGMLFAISPWLGLISFGTFVLILICTRYVSLGSMICMFIPAFLIFVVPLDNFYLFDHSLLYSNDYHPDTWGRVIFLIEMLCNSAIVFIRHKPNIQRLWKHEEKRFF
jgi:acyl-phosphate glycerol 3-phosphate acyltransferase